MGGSQQSPTLPNVSPPMAPSTEAHVNLKKKVAKTRSQLNRRLPDGAKLAWPPFGKAWYAGCTTLIIGNSLKAGISTFLPLAYLPTYLPTFLQRDADAGE